MGSRAKLERHCADAPSMEAAPAPSPAAASPQAVMALGDFINAVHAVARIQERESVAALARLPVFTTVPGDPFVRSSLNGPSASISFKALSIALSRHAVEAVGLACGAAAQRVLAPDSSGGWPSLEPFVCIARTVYLYFIAAVLSLETAPAAEQPRRLLAAARGGGLRKRRTSLSLARESVRVFDFRALVADLAEGVVAVGRGAATLWNAEAYLLLGLARAAAGHPLRSLAALRISDDIVLEKKPFAHRARLFEEQDSRPPTFISVLGLHPSLLGSRLAQVSQLLQIGDFGAALTILRTWFVRWPPRHENERYLAVAERKVRLLSGCALLGLSHLCTEEADKTSRAQEAVEHFLAAASLRPDGQTEVEQTAAEALSAMSEPTKRAASAPTSSEAFYGAAHAAAMRRDWDFSLRLTRTALTLDDTRWEHWALLVALQSVPRAASPRQCLLNALATLEHALDLFPEQPVVLMQAALATARLSANYEPFALPSRGAESTPVLAMLDSATETVFGDSTSGEDAERHNLSGELSPQNGVPSQLSTLTRIQRCDAAPAPPVSLGPSLPDAYARRTLTLLDVLICCSLRLRYARSSAGGSADAPTLEGLNFLARLSTAELADIMRCTANIDRLRLADAGALGDDSGGGDLATDSGRTELEERSWTSALRRIQQLPRDYRVLRSRLGVETTYLPAVLLFGAALTTALRNLPLAEFFLRINRTVLHALNRIGGTSHLFTDGIAHECAELRVGVVKAATEPGIVSDVHARVAALQRRTMRDGEALRLGAAAAILGGNPSEALDLARVACAAEPRDIEAAWLALQAAQRLRGFPAFELAALQARWLLLEDSCEQLPLPNLF